MVGSTPIICAILFVCIWLKVLVVLSLYCHFFTLAIIQVITHEAIFYGTEDSREKASLVDWVLPYAQRYIYKLHPDKYSKLKQFKFENLCHLQIIVVQKLFYRHALKRCDSVSKKQVQCSSLLQVCLNASL